MHTINRSLQLISAYQHSLSFFYFIEVCRQLPIAACTNLDTLVIWISTQIVTIKYQQLSSQKIEVDLQSFIQSCLPYVIGVFLKPFSFTNLIVESYWSKLNVISRPIADTDKEKSGRNRKLTYKNWKLAGTKYQSIKPVQ